MVWKMGKNGMENERMENGGSRDGMKVGIGMV